MNDSSPTKRGVLSVLALISILVVAGCAGAENAIFEEESPPSEAAADQQLQTTLTPATTTKQTPTTVPERSDTPTPTSTEPPTETETETEAAEECEKTAPRDPVETSSVRATALKSDVVVVWGDLRDGRNGFTNVDPDGPIPITATLYDENGTVLETKEVTVPDPGNWPTSATFSVAFDVPAEDVARAEAQWSRNYEWLNGDTICEQQ